MDDLSSVNTGVGGSTIQSPTTTQETASTGHVAFQPVVTDSISAAPLSIVKDDNYIAPSGQPALPKPVGDPFKGMDLDNVQDAVSGINTMTTLIAQNGGSLDGLDDILFNTPEDPKEDDPEVQAFAAAMGMPKSQLAKALKEIKQTVEKKMSPDEIKKLKESLGKLESQGQKQDQAKAMDSFLKAATDIVNNMPNSPEKESMIKYLTLLTKAKADIEKAIADQDKIQSTKKKALSGQKIDDAVLASAQARVTHSKKEDQKLVKNAKGSSASTKAGYGTQKKGVPEPYPNPPTKIMTPEERNHYYSLTGKERQAYGDAFMKNYNAMSKDEKASFMLGQKEKTKVQMAEYNKTLPSQVAEHQKLVKEAQERLKNNDYPNTRETDLARKKELKNEIKWGGFNRFCNSIWHLFTKDAWTMKSFKAAFTKDGCRRNFGMRCKDPYASNSSAIGRLFTKDAWSMKSFKAAFTKDGCRRNLGMRYKGQDMAKERPAELELKEVNARLAADNYAAEQAPGSMLDPKVDDLIADTTSDYLKKNVKFTPPLDESMQQLLKLFIKLLMSNPNAPDPFEACGIKSDPPIKKAVEIMKPIVIQQIASTFTQNLNSLDSVESTTIDAINNSKPLKQGLANAKEIIKVTQSLVEEIPESPERAVLLTYLATIAKAINKLQDTLNELGAAKSDLSRRMTLNKMSEQLLNSKTMQEQTAEQAKEMAAKKNKMAKMGKFGKVMDIVMKIAILSVSMVAMPIGPLLAIRYIEQDNIKHGTGTAFEKKMNKGLDKMTGHCYTKCDYEKRMEAVSNWCVEKMGKHFGGYMGFVVNNLMMAVITGGNPLIMMEMFTKEGGPLDRFLLTEGAYGNPPNEMTRAITLCVANVVVNVAVTVAFTILTGGAGAGAVAAEAAEASAEIGEASAAAAKAAEAAAEAAEAAQATAEATATASKSVQAAAQTGTRTIEAAGDASTAATQASRSAELAGTSAEKAEEAAQTAQSAADKSLKAYRTAAKAQKAGEGSMETVVEAQQASIKATETSEQATKAAQEAQQAAKSAQQTAKSAQETAKVANQAAKTGEMSAEASTKAASTADKAATSAEKSTQAATSTEKTAQLSEESVASGDKITESTKTAKSAYDKTSTAKMMKGMSVAMGAVGIVQAEEGVRSGVIQVQCALIDIRLSKMKAKLDISQEKFEAVMKMIEQLIQTMISAISETPGFILQLNQFVSKMYNEANDYTFQG